MGRFRALDSSLTIRNHQGGELGKLRSPFIKAFGRRKVNTHRKLFVNLRNDGFNAMSAQKIDIISRASQGNPKAISDLLNRALAPKNIVVRAKLMQDCLTIFAEGNELPDQLSLVGVIRRGINDLSIDSLASVKVYGKLSGETSSSWSETI